MRLKLFVQNESVEELENRVNKWIEEMEKEGGTFKDVAFEMGVYGVSIIVMYEEKKNGNTKNT